jgi:hypothetical protein
MFILKAILIKEFSLSAMAVSTSFLAQEIKARQEEGNKYTYKYLNKKLEPFSKLELFPLKN